jgi:transposase
MRRGQEGYGKEGILMQVTVVGLDISKQVFQLHGVSAEGKVVLRKRLRRLQVAAFMAQLPPCLIGIEAGAGAHYWARVVQQYGHEVKLISPQYVKPYLKGNKNDANDAEAICEAVSRPTMRFVAVKSVAHQDLQMLHRVRERCIKARTALVNQIRGLLSEYGIVLPTGIHRLRQALPQLLETETLTPLGREVFTQLYEELVALDQQVGNCEQRITRWFKSDATCQRLAQVNGVGLLTATAFVAAVANPAVFKNGRQVSAWLGLVPRQASTGGKTVLLGISKRGDCYLRSLLIHGARAVMRYAAHREEGRYQWVRQVMHRRGVNRATVALANKNARRLWALMRDPTPEPQAASGA